jgi:hypothetical protein
MYSTEVVEHHGGKAFVEFYEDGRYVGRRRIATLAQDGRQALDTRPWSQGA